MAANPTDLFLGDGMKVVPVSGLQVRISVGRGWFFDSTEADPDAATFKPMFAENVIDVTLNAAHPTLTRIDIISVQPARVNDVSENRVFATDPVDTFPPDTTTASTVKKSVDSVSHVYTAGTAGGGVPSTPSGYTKIAEIEVGPGVVTITSGNITDTRQLTVLPSARVSVDPTGNLTSTDVQSALEELQSDVDANTSGITTKLNTTVFDAQHNTSTGAHQTMTADKITVTQTTNDNALVIAKTNTGSAASVSVPVTADYTGVSVLQSSGDAPSLVNIQQLNASATGIGLFVRHDGSGPGVQVNTTGSGVTLRLASTATDNPVINITANNSNARGDISFALRTAGASSPDEGDVWYQTATDRFEAHIAGNAGSGRTIPFATKFAFAFGPWEDEEIDASGNLTVTAGARIRVFGNGGGGADDLDNFVTTGAGLQDGDAFMCQVDTASLSNITFRHKAGGTGNLRNKDSGSPLLNTQFSNIIYMYDAVNSVYIEVGGSRTVGV